MPYQYDPARAHQNPYRRDGAHWYFHGHPINVSGGGGTYTAEQLYKKLDDATARGWYPWVDHPARPVDVEWQFCPELNDAIIAVVLESHLDSRPHYPPGPSYSLLWVRVVPAPPQQPTD